MCRRKLLYDFDDFDMRPSLAQPPRFLQIWTTFNHSYDEILSDFNLCPLKRKPSNFESLSRLVYCGRMWCDGISRLARRKLKIREWSCSSVESSQPWDMIGMNNAVCYREGRLQTATSQISWGPKRTRRCQNGNKDHLAFRGANNKSICLVCLLLVE